MCAPFILELVSVVSEINLYDFNTHILFSPHIQSYRHFIPHSHHCYSVSWSAVGFFFCPLKLTLNLIFLQVLLNSQSFKILDCYLPSLSFYFQLQCSYVMPPLTLWTTAVCSSLAGSCATRVTSVCIRNSDFYNIKRHYRETPQRTFGVKL